MRWGRGLYIHNEFCEALGRTREEIGRMSLRDLANAAYDRGLELRVKQEGGDGPGLTLTVEKVECSCPASST
jgi:hypothetical protein